MHVGKTCKTATIWNEMAVLNSLSFPRYTGVMREYENASSVTLNVL